MKAVGIMNPGKPGLSRGLIFPLFCVTNTPRNLFAGKYHLSGKRSD